MIKLKIGWKRFRNAKRSLRNIALAANFPIPLLGLIKGFARGLVQKSFVIVRPRMKIDNCFLQVKVCHHCKKVFETTLFSKKYCNLDCQRKNAMKRNKEKCLS